jgi:hypothetical protein
MKKRHYGGILARPIARDENEGTARQSRFEALFSHYNIAEPFTPTGWEELAKALAAAHVPGFSIQQSAKKPPRQVGNKPKLSSFDLLHAAVQVLQLFHKIVECPCAGPATSFGGDGKDTSSLSVVSKPSGKMSLP